MIGIEGRGGLERNRITEKRGRIERIDERVKLCE